MNCFAFFNFFLKRRSLHAINPIIEKGISKKTAYNADELNYIQQQQQINTTRIRYSVQNTVSVLGTT